MATNHQDLKSTLWEAANILRGSAVDRTDWKGYILPLLFFKRICDVWEEETADAAETYGDVDPSQFPEVHRFQVPEGCHWRDIRETPANVGTALQRAMQEIERANPDTLYRVFGSADWGNREKFTDELLKDMIEGFSSISLGTNDVDTDILGDAYEYLVGKFADVNRRNKAGERKNKAHIIDASSLFRKGRAQNFLDPEHGEQIVEWFRAFEDVEDRTKVVTLDEIVRFDGWQNTHAGEREVKMALRKTLFKYRLHQEQELFGKAYKYIATYY